jgi:hypothetical protein
MRQTVVREGAHPAQCRSQSKTAPLRFQYVSAASDGKKLSRPSPCGKTLARRRLFPSLLIDPMYVF